MPKESQVQRQKRFLELLRLLKKYYPDAHCSLDHKNPEELLVATVLSAQCTDERVNKVTPALFAKYPTMASLAQAEIKELENLVRSTGFFHNKAKNLKALAQVLVASSGGKVPKDFPTLVNLPGVGRKTANVVMGNAFGVASGVVVDTHVQRLSGRLGLTASANPQAIERDLMKLVPEAAWVELPHLLIYHGRQVCKARSPACHTCFLADICPKKMG